MPVAVKISSIYFSAVHNKVAKQDMQILIVIYSTVLVYQQ
jgi:hypothetical protein